MPKELFTVGYEGIDIDSFLDCLESNSIDCLLDVREIPLSRKKGFSKTKLSERLSQENIQYIHFKELGSPKPIRQELKTNRDYSTFFKKMNRYLNNKKDTIEKAHGYVMNYTCCLLCFESGNRFVDALRA